MTLEFYDAGWYVGDAGSSELGCGAPDVRIDPRYFKGTPEQLMELWEGIVEAAGFVGHHSVVVRLSGQALVADVVELLERLGRTVTVISVGPCTYDVIL